jgi:DnaJ-class molecular chaperone
MKDYYQILGVEEDSGEEEIRKKYRQLAMQYHPDRNPDDPESESRFKEIAEAYGVLTDPVKKREYDTARATGGSWQQNGDGGFNYSQEDILRDLFRDPRFQSMFQSLLREFQRSGFRANPNFVRQSFFGGKGTLLFGGLFLFGSLAGPALLKAAKKGLPERTSMGKSLQGAIGSLLGGGKRQESAPAKQPSPGTNDVTYVTPLSAQELQDGKTIQVVTQGPDGQEMLNVKIPPGSRAGQKLRIAGKGAQGEHGRGNLFLELREQ